MLIQDPNTDDNYPRTRSSFNIKKAYYLKQAHSLFIKNCLFNKDQKFYLNKPINYDNEVKMSCPVSRCKN